MVLPASGNSISLDQIHVELGESSGSTVALGDDDVRALASDTSGAIGMDQFFGLSNVTNIEDVFSIHHYEGNAQSTHNIQNGINLSGDGGAVFLKYDSTGVLTHPVIFDTERGVNQLVFPSQDIAAYGSGDNLTAFNNNGFTVGNSTFVNAGSDSNFYSSHTFKKHTGFFDVLTYTGNGSNRTIAHSLGAEPGMIWVKCTSDASDWCVYHRGAAYGSVVANQERLVLNETDGSATESTIWNNTSPTASVFSIGTHADINTNNRTYIAYIFGHKGNNDTGAIIQCGNYEGNGVSLSDSSAFKSVNVGFEPEYLMIKRTDGTGRWCVFDEVRGLSAYQASVNRMYSFDQNTEYENDTYVTTTATGFDLISNNADVNTDDAQYIYMAIRKGPMAEPTSGNDIYTRSVYNVPGNTSADGVQRGPPFLSGSEGSSHSIVNKPADLVVLHWTAKKYLYFRNTISNPYNKEYIWGETGIDSTNSDAKMDWQNGFGKGGNAAYNWNDASIAFMFHDRVKAFKSMTYRGTGSNRTVAHNLGAAPELLIIKNTTQTDNWVVYYGDNTDHLHLNSVGGTADDNTHWNDTSPTSSVFTVGTHHDVNASNEFYVAFMFATLAGVTKVGTVSVTGATNVDCGFSSGAQFVMIKRYNGNGHWIVFDGIVSGNDTYRKMDHNSAAVTNADVIDPLDAGFSLTAAFLNITNNGSGNYVFVAIAA